MNEIHPNDDLWYAIKNNPSKLIKPEDITDILAEVPGANDELNWYWVVSLKNGHAGLIYGGCDYTGWDCRSFLKYGIFEDPWEAAEWAPDREEYSDRRIYQVLCGQLRGDIPFALYEENWDGMGTG